MTAADDLIQEWRQRLQQDCPNQGQAIRESVVQWLVGETPEQLDQMSADELAITQQALDYRYRILRQRYWGISAEMGYQRLLRRLSSLFLIRSKIRTWIALSRDRKRTVQDVLQEVLQDMLQSDRHLRQQITWVARCSRQSWLRNLLTLATLEEYCLRPIRNHPLVGYRFVNYLRRSQKAGVTQVPTGELVRLVSDEIATDDPETSLSLLDVQALSRYQEQTALIEQQILRTQVKQEFMAYLATVRTRRKTIENFIKNIQKVPIGGTAVGSGANSHKDYHKIMIKNLEKFCKVKLKGSKEKEEMQF